MNQTPWQFINASVIGPTHRNREEPCQDASLVRTLSLVQGHYLIGCCCDGAGSAYLAAQGAELACQTVVGFASHAVRKRGGLQSTTKQNVSDWIAGASEKLSDMALDRHAKKRDAACTMLLSVVGPELALFVQIGDGAIVINAENGSGYDVVFWPQMGEYAGTTNFLTDPNAADSFVFKQIERPITHLAMFTDGVQMLGLDFGRRTAHQPFFDPLFEAMHQQPDVNHLNQPFRDFLGSSDIDARTDDDRTLILATRATRTD